MRVTSPLTAAIVGGASLGLLTFSQLGGIFDGDEGLHLVAAQLVQAGRTPFVDFFYWHQPLYLYVAAGWMSVVADGWRGLHALSAVLTAATAFLIGGYVPRTPEREAWRPWTNALAVLLFALNVLVVKWGTMAHNYALCMLLGMAAFRAATSAVSRESERLAFCAGLCAGGATATSLLMAPIGPMLGLWLVAQRRVTRRRRALSAFLLGLPVAFIPLGVLALQAPDRTTFGVLTHHLYFRVPFTDPTALQVETLTGWVRSPQAVLLIALCGVGLLALWRQGTRGQRLPMELSLCAALACGLALFAAIAHPPAHTVYFVIASPFVAVLGSYAACSVGRDVAAQRLIACAVAAVFVLGLMIPFYRERMWRSDWARIERFAAEVSRVTPADGEFYTTFPFIYVAARRAPPAGTENFWASEMTLPRERFEALGVLPIDDVTAAIRSGRYRSLILLETDSRADPGRYPARLPLDRYWTLRWRDAASDAPAH